MIFTQGTRAFWLYFACIVLSLNFLSLSAWADRAIPQEVKPREQTGEVTDLFELVERNQETGAVERLEQLLKKGASPNQTKNGVSLLNHAVWNTSKSQYHPPSDIRSGRYDHVLLLLQYGAEACAGDSDGRSPLHTAAKKGDVNLVYLFLEKGCDIQARDKEGRTPAEYALPFGKDALNILLHRGADPNAKKDRNGNVLLSLALYFQDDEVVELLLQHGADPVPVLPDQQRRLKEDPSPKNERLLKLLQEYAQWREIEKKQSEPLETIKFSPPPPLPLEKRPPKTDPPLIGAIRDNNFEEVEQLLSGGSDPNSISESYVHGKHDYREAATYGATALHVALFKESYEIAKRLIQLGADVNIRSAVTDYSDGVPPLMLSLNNYEMAKYLLDHGANPNLASAKFRDTAIMKAENLDVIALLLERGADINHRSQYNSSALKDAAYAEDYARVKVLLDHGADVNVMDDNNQTPLFAAIGKANEPLVRLFLEKGASLQLKDYQGLNVYEFALLQKQNQLASLLKQVGASYGDKIRVMRQAIYQGHVDLIAQFLKEGLNPNSDPKEPFLIQASYYQRDVKNKSQIIQILIEYGADIFVTDSNKRTVIHLVDNPEIAELLLTKGLPVDSADDQGQSALHGAARRGLVEKVRVLLKHRANPNLKDRALLTPLHNAAMGPIDHRPGDGSPPDWERETPLYLQTIEVLLKAGADPNVFAGDYYKTPIEIVKRHIQNKEFREKALEFREKALRLFRESADSLNP